MFNNNDGFNGGINQINSYQNNINSIDSNMNMFQNSSSNNNSNEYCNMNNLYGGGDDSLNRNMIQTSYSNNVLGNTTNNISCINNSQNKNSFNFYGKEETPNCHQEALFTKVKQNVSIFGNKMKNTPLFGNNIRNEMKRGTLTGVVTGNNMGGTTGRTSEMETIRFNDFVSRDKSIFGNRLREGKPLFSSIKNVNPTLPSTHQNLNYDVSRNMSNWGGHNSSYTNYSSDPKNASSYMYNSCVGNDAMGRNVHSMGGASGMSNMMQEQGNPMFNTYNSNIASRAQENLPTVGAPMYLGNFNYNGGGIGAGISGGNSLQAAYLQNSMVNSVTESQNCAPFSAQNVMNSHDNLSFNMNNTGILPNYSNFLLSNNAPSGGNNNNPNNSSSSHQFSVSNSNIISELNTLPSGDLFYINKNKTEQEPNVNYNNSDFNNQTITANVTSEHFNFSNRSNYVGENENDITKNSTKEIEGKNILNEDSSKLSEVEVPFTNNNEVMFEKNYIQNVKKKILFFNNKFMKSLELINNHNLNSYNENRSTIYNFPCSSSFNNSIFYLKAVEECKCGERFDVNNELYNKLFCKNLYNEFTVLKNINMNEKINIQDFDLNIYYPLLHVEKIKFRKSITTEDSYKHVSGPFELGKIPTVI
ncbi:conserved Plasmodium protein, unknown function [Plasmodium ovale]|uniref:Uncharacterized protein n=2 Tax=Plasmodium ovale TaxID=36330 RepID=A0A1A8WUI9_PLAOA|nr:conserved Plasmodium protein, unknown function [Plasmodium ovale curtisi]SBS96626.1 conserved Plasmodium protein, unknown function [Plasmodium ovale curtisi]SCP05547.1 conserved Plasmodium protein, unknown function [Plasmodium ovale]